MAHKHSCTANTDEVYRTFIGCTVKGMYKGQRSVDAGSSTVLVFDCGWGLAINSNGSCWVESPDKVQVQVERVRNALENTQRELADILALAGET